MPVDVAAEVIANTPLSADYNVLALRAPAIARVAAPGQFVMVKAGPGTTRCCAGRFRCSKSCAIAPARRPASRC